MRRCLAGLLALAAVAPTGCFTTPPDRSISRFAGRMPFTTLTGDDVVQLDVYLVECSVADRRLNGEVWELGDEQVLQERKHLLEENGLRACVFGETAPDGLQGLMHSERSCANPRRLRLHVDKPATVLLGPLLPDLQFQLHQDARTADVDLEQAQCVLQVTTRVLSDGRLTLHFTPAVRHGPPAVTPRAVQEPSGSLRWDVQTEQPTEVYSGLSWDFTVASNAYIAVGMLPSRENTLGPAAFLSEGPPRKQRLLVLRPSRASAEDRLEEAQDKSPSLASQAGCISTAEMAP